MVQETYGVSKSRTLHKRRERRKAKQSGFTRPGKAKPGVVGHGGSSLNTYTTSGLKIRPQKFKKETAPKLLVKILEVIKK